MVYFLYFQENDYFLVMSLPYQLFVSDDKTDEKIPDFPLKCIWKKLNVRTNKNGKK